MSDAHANAMRILRAVSYRARGRREWDFGLPPESKWDGQDPAKLFCIGGRDRRDTWLFRACHEIDGIERSAVRVFFRGLLAPTEEHLDGIRNRGFSDGVDSAHAEWREKLRWLGAWLESAAFNADLRHPRDGMPTGTIMRVLCVHELIDQLREMGVEP